MLRGNESSDKSHRSFWGLMSPPGLGHFYTLSCGCGILHSHGFHTWNFLFVQFSNIFCNCRWIIPFISYLWVNSSCCYITKWTNHSNVKILWLHGINAIHSHPGKPLLISLAQNHCVFACILAGRGLVLRAGMVMKSHFSVSGIKTPCLLLIFSFPSI